MSKEDLATQISQTAKDIVASAFERHDLGITETHESLGAVESASRLAKASGVDIQDGLEAVNKGKLTAKARRN